MKRPCSQACRLTAKYGSAGACSTSTTSADSTTSPMPAAARRGSSAISAASSAPSAKPAAAFGVRQASAWSGPKFIAVDRVVAAAPSVAAPASITKRRQPGCVIVSAIMHGAIRPSATVASSWPAESRSSVGRACSQGPAQSSIALPSSTARSVSCRRTHTWPSPSGTGAGNSSPSGQSSSKASPPALPPMNQRSRSACQRSRPPSRCTTSPSAAPQAAPATFSARSRLEATRSGR